LRRLTLVIKTGTLRSFVHVERKNDDNWVKRCMTMDINYNALDKGD